MASKGNWTIVFDDKVVIKNYAEGANEGVGYKIDDDAFWNDSKFSNISGPAAKPGIKYIGVFVIYSISFFSNKMSSKAS